MVTGIETPSLSDGDWAYINVADGSVGEGVRVQGCDVELALGEGAGDEEAVGGCGRRQQETVSTHWSRHYHHSHHLHT